MKNTILIIFAIISTISINAQVWHQMGENLYGESFWDKFGEEVSINADGSIIAVGIDYDDTEGDDAGCVKIYRFVSGEWQQMGDDILGTNEDDFFGGAISLNASGLIIAIGAIYNDESYENAGQVKIFEFSSNNWTQVGNSINGSAKWDLFGSSVSLSDNGNTVAIATEYSDEEGEATGQVRIFENINNVWTQIGSTITGDTINDRFGMSVSLSGNANVVAVGAIGQDSAKGYVRAFNNNSGTWEQIGDDITGVGSNDFFGYALSLNYDGSIIAGGSSGNDGNGQNAGHVRIFNNISDNWVQIGQDIEGEAAGDFSGYSLDLSSDGTIVAIGADKNDGGATDAGYVRIFENNNNTWTQIGESINGIQEDEGFGYSVAISADGDVVVAGAWQNDSIATNAGSVRIYSTKTVKITDINNDDFLIYPNPTNGIFSILSEKTISNIEILDVSGKKIIETKQKNINISNQPNGIYFVKITTSEGIINKKIILHN